MTDTPADETRRRHRDSSYLMSYLLLAAFLFVLVTVGFNVYLTLDRTDAATRAATVALARAGAACSFYRDLAGSPVTIAAGTGKPSELGVAIIAHSREAYRGSGCAGTLPPPSATFAKWAPYYHLSAE
jgi:hypothetical protein